MEQRTGEIGEQAGDGHGVPVRDERFAAKNVRHGGAWRDERQIEARVPPRVANGKRTGARPQRNEQPPGHDDERLALVHAGKRHDVLDGHNAAVTVTSAEHLGDLLDEIYQGVKAEKTPIDP